MIICIISKMHCKRPTPNAEFTRLWERQAEAFVLSMPKVNTAAWWYWRLHSVFTALLAFAQRAHRRSAFF